MLGLNIIQKFRLSQFDFDYLAQLGLQGQFPNNLLANISVDSGAYAVLTN